MRNKLFVASAMFLALFMINAAFVLADNCPPGVTGTCITNPLGNASICDLINAVLNAAMLIGAPIAVLFVVIAGARFVFARGNQETLKKAKTNLLWTLIGIAIFFGAAVLTLVIINTIKPLLQQNNQSIGSC